ncbi:hypothetical protein SOVF_196160 [Spinacia oleracea]|uniref:Uncharacterized protein n=1 Tax=Spinacia oleracea TaxID=3562 RepID=A0A9R0JS77_SPIOL|nr:uncharacterized protein LOC110785047 [Spinacia oleracea]KNA04822.1 hypothetical protein SOVF_196160 [Spinacia oleracea]
MVGSSEISEESSDWEVIQHPFDHRASSPPPQGQLLGYEIVIRDNYYDDNSSIFPPSEHEDLPLVGEQDSDSLQSPLPSAGSNTGALEEEKMKPDSRLSIMMNEIGTRMFTFGTRLFQVFLCSNSTRCFSIFPAAALMVALFAIVKILQWRNRFLLLVREKDQRISQLLHQIAHMNEILSARRKVPVLRIN